MVSIADLETITDVTDLLTDGHLIGTYNNEDGTTFDLLETVTSLASDGQNLVFTDENGDPTTISIADLETLTTITEVVTTGHLIGVYENEAGALVDLRETITAIALTGPDQITFTDELGNDTVIDLPNLETITDITALLDDGHLIGTYNNEDGTTFDLLETVTALADNGDGTYTFTHEDGTTSTIDTVDIETITDITDLLDDGHLIGTYNNEDGTTFDLRETVTALADNGDGTYTFTHEDGTASTIDATAVETLTTLTNTIAGNRIGTYTDEATGSFDINETITELVDNGDGTLTYVDEAGEKHLIEISDGVVHPVQVIYEEFYAGGTDDGLNLTWGRNLKMQRIAQGIWEVGFVAPHPDGTAYAINVLTQEEANLRDSVLPWVEQGSKTPNGFIIHLVTGDNGGTADTYVDTPFTVSVNAPVKVLVEGP